MMDSAFRDKAVLAGAAGSLAAGGLHVATLPFGARGLRYFGAGRRLIDLAERGSPLPGVLTASIAGGLAVAGLYARAQVGHNRPLPWQHRVYAFITTIYVLRGIALVPQVGLSVLGTNVGPRRELVFSAVALTLGLLHVPGLAQSGRTRTAAL